MEEQPRSRKRRHHFVPRSYLRAFASEERRIHLFNLPMLLPIPSVSLRNQCFRHRFYGTTDEVEDGFAQIEARTAPVFAKLRDLSPPPHLGDAEHESLLDFVNIQIHRTEAAVKRAQSMFAATELPGLEGPRPFDFDVDEDRAVAILVRSLPEIRPVFEDLGFLVVRAPVGTRLITSDHPVVKFNNYCSGRFDVGVLGTDCRGLQLSLPISPEVAIVLYDREVYQTDDASGRTDASSKDIEALNRLQIFGARENLYFSTWDDVQSIASLVGGTTDRQSLLVTQMEAAIPDDLGRVAVFVATSDVLPDLPMDLSCLPLRRDAAAVLPGDRIHKFRHEASELRPHPPNIYDNTRFRILEQRNVRLHPTPGSRKRSN